MLLAALALVLGLLPAVLAQYPPECNPECTPVEDYLHNCGTLPTPAEGLACIHGVCTAPTLNACVACSSAATGLPVEQYYGMFGCPVPAEPTEPVASSTTAEATTPTCRRPGKGKGKGHDKGRGKGHGKHGDDSDSDSDDE